MISFSGSDILKALELVPGWKAVASLPKRLADLEARIAALEKAAGKPNTAGADACPKCGATMTLQSETEHPHFGVMGVKRRMFLCDACGTSAERDWSPSKGYR